MVGVNEQYNEEQDEVINMCGDMYLKRKCGYEEGGGVSSIDNNACRRETR